MTPVFVRVPMCVDGLLSRETLAIGSVLCPLEVQVLNKIMPIDVVLRERELTDLFIQEKLERQSAWANLRSLAKSQELLLGLPLTAAMPSDALVLRPLLLD